MNSSREDYIQVIYRLSIEKGYTNNKEIARYLNVSKPSVSEMIKKLSKDRLINVNKNKISLSRKGNLVAEEIISKHRIWEYFLSEKLKLPKNEIHGQADILEHATDDKLKEALNRYLGYPKICPHGKKIYGNENKITKE